MTNVDRTRKLLVRTALVTSSTIATLVGAQTLALLDTRQTEQIITPLDVPGEILGPVPVSSPMPQTVIPAAPALEIIHAAPSVTILRRAGEAGPLQTTSNRVTVIQPPDPVQLAVPQPVIVQGEAPAPIIIQQSSNASSDSGGASSRTQSSR